MIKNLKIKIKNKFEIIGLIFLILITTFLTSYHNFNNKIKNETYNNFIDNIYLKKTLNHIVNNLEPKYQKFNHKIKSGETFDKILNSFSIDKDEIIIIKKNLQKKVDLNKLNTRQSIKFSLDKTNNKITEFIFKVSNTEKISLKRNIEDDLFDQKTITIKLNKKIIFKENIILQSLYGAATNENIPANIIIEFARIYGFQVDFQRDIRKKDKFQIMYEIFLNEKNEIIETGEILYANLKLSGQDNNLYYFDNDGSEGHYDKNGKSVKKALMKTPINGARLSSGFGKRMHPVLGYSKMHKGVDFAAKRGTPVYAAGDGVVERANIYGSYGKYIRIRHNSQYKTAYAHLRRFAKKIKKNINVKQGQIIGYVGSTGRSTGPHLHYEILLNNKQINPQKLKLPEGKKLDEDETKEFKKIRESILTKISDYIIEPYK